MYRPKRFTKNELLKANVILEDDRRIILRCGKCRQGWSPNIKAGGKLPRGYWKCPNGCNE